MHRKRNKDQRKQKYMMYDPQQHPESYEAQRQFTEHYLAGHTPWDSGISPPELMDAMTGSHILPRGNALDIGCGTGTNSLEMAKHGWSVLGIDFAEPAIAQANKKAEKKQDEIARHHGHVHFLCVDITRLEAPSKPYTLIFDLGCLNGIPYAVRPAYARIVADYAAPGACFLLYVHLPQAGRKPFGCTPEEIDDLFAPSFTLERREMGKNPQGGNSMWNWLRRTT
jgi:SAM-dependent methyltransferase